MTTEELLANYFYTIEQALRKLSINPDKVKDPQESGLWVITRGSANVFVKLFYEVHKEVPYMSVVCPMMAVPASNKVALYKELLRLNEAMFAVGFSVLKGVVYLRTIRPVWGMDENEAFHLINRVGFYADKHDDELIARYGGDLAFGMSKEHIPFF